MSTAEHAAMLQSTAVYREAWAGLDPRTIEILERRRRAVVIKRRGWLVRRMLLAADVAGLAASFLVAEVIVTAHRGAADALAQRLELLIFLLTIPGWIVVAKLYGLYDHDEERADHSTADDVVGVFHMLTVGAWIFLAGAWVTRLADPDFLKIFVFWTLAIAFVSLGRAGARAYCRRQIAYLQNTVIVGAGDIGQLVARKLLNHPEYGINLVGFVDDAPKAQRADLAHLTLLGGPDRLPELIELLDVERVIVAFSNESHEDTLDLLRLLRDKDVQIDIVPRLFDMLGPGVGLHTVEGLPLLALPTLRLSRSSRLLKRALDVAVASLALVVLAPVLAVIAALIRQSSPGSVLFRQIRMGSGDETFRIFKFRTMVADADERKAEFAHLNMHARDGGDPRMFKIAEDPRVTAIGAFLRRYSLDELPQLLNVLLGDMSLVGPRPLILAEDQYVEAWGRQRLNLKPGVTGPWQVLGRNEIPFEEMIKLDYHYVTAWSLLNDLKLIFRTIPVVFRGAY